MRQVSRKKQGSVVTVSLLAIATMLVIAAKVNGESEPAESENEFIPNGTPFLNARGASQTYSTVGGGINLTGPFFQSLGTNGRSCGSCHKPSDGMSVSALNVQRRFNHTQGLDPIFRPVDGSNCNHNIDVSTVSGRSAAYSLLRRRGLIRIAIAVPANAD